MVHLSFLPHYLKCLTLLNLFFYLEGFPQHSPLTWISQALKSQLKDYVLDAFPQACRWNWSEKSSLCKVLLPPLWLCFFLLAVWWASHTFTTVFRGWASSSFLCIPGDLPATVPALVLGPGQTWYCCMVLSEVGRGVHGFISPLPHSVTFATKEMHCLVVSSRMHRQVKPGPERVSLMVPKVTELASHHSPIYSSGAVT